MKIDIDKLTEAELIDLNHRIVARLRFLHKMRAHTEMLEFRIGDRVTFQPPGQGQVEGRPMTRQSRAAATTSRVTVLSRLISLICRTCAVNQSISRKLPALMVVVGPALLAV